MMKRPTMLNKYFTLLRTIALGLSFRLVDVSKLAVHLNFIGFLLFVDFKGYVPRFID